MNTQDKIFLPGEYNIDDLTLSTYKGMNIDLRDNLLEFVLHESFDLNCLGGQLIIVENVNLIKNLNLIGNETLTVSLTTPSRFGNKESIKNKFIVYKIDNRVDTDENKKLNIYTLYFVSPEFIESSKIKISRSFYNISFGDMAKIIAEKYLKTKKNINIQPTLNKKQFILPYMSPLDALNTIANESVSEDSKHFFYRFYETCDGFNFSSFNRKSDEMPSITYVYYKVNPSIDDYVLKSINSDFQRIEQYDIVSYFNTIDNLKNGMLSSKNLYFDITTKKYHIHDYNYISDFDQLKTLYQNKILPNNIDVIKNANYSNYNYYVASTNQYSNVLSNYYNNNSPFSTSYKRSLDNYRLEILVAGDSSRRVGEVVECKIFSGEALSDSNQDPFDPYISGKYIIRKITHILQKNGYRMRLFLEKDSLAKSV